MTEDGEPERPQFASSEHVTEAKKLASQARGDAAALAEEAAVVVSRLRAVEMALRSRTRIIIGVGVLIALVGVFMVLNQLEGNRQRQLILRAVQEIKDCTTPADQTTACQQRLSVQSRERSVDNLRASIAVGSCLRAQSPDVGACSLQEFQRLREAGKP